MIARKGRLNDWNRLDLQRLERSEAVERFEHSIRFASFSKLPRRPIERAYDFNSEKEANSQLTQRA